MTVATYDPTMKRGRGRPSNAEVAARQDWLNKFKKPQRTDTEILSETRKKFALLNDLTVAAAKKKNLPLAIVSGAPGIGKTYTITRALDANSAKHTIVNGSISPVNLYVQAYKMREAGNILLIDDGDSVFDSEESVNLLKAMTDSVSDRRVSYYKESPKLAEENVEQTFVFRGSIIILSNKDFDMMIASGNRMAPHIAAIQSRSIYVDLAIHSQHEILLYIKDVAKDGMLWKQYDVPAKVGNNIIDFLTTHKDRARHLSLRTISVCCNMYHLFGPDKYENALLTQLR